MQKAEKVSTSLDTCIEQIAPTLTAMAASRQLAYSWLSDEDMAQELTLACMRAAQEFDGSNGASLETFASVRIRFAALAYARSERNRGIVTGHRNTAVLFEESGDSDAADVWQTIEDDEATGRSYSPADRADQLDDIAEDELEDACKHVYAAIKTLPIGDTRILRMYYGLPPYSRSHTLAQCAQRLGLGYPAAASRKLDASLALVRQKMAAANN